MPELLHGRFKLLKQLGSGGTGEVYRALDTRLHRLVALKRVRDGTPEERRRRGRRLIREAENLARVRHPNVVMIHDVIEEGGRVSIILELVAGDPFRRLFKKGPIAEHDLLGYLRQLAGALDAVHAAGIIHRDVNPRNVLVAPGAIIKLTDFGLSSSIRDPVHRAGGTIGYMAPEALRKGRQLGFGVDVYSLGLLAYQALLGGPVFKKLYGAPTALEWARWTLSREKFKTLISLEAVVSPVLSAIIERMLEKDPAERYQKIADVLKDLERLGA
jgi:serine/threonine-protein kinase